MNRKDADTARRLGPSAWRDDWMTPKETLMDEPADASGRTRADRAEDLTHADSEPEIGIYRERAYLVAHLAALHPSHIGHTDPDEPDWAVLIVETPEGQMSWHIAPDDLDLFEHVHRMCEICRGWDGHTTPEKYRRLRALTAAPRAPHAATATNDPGDDAGAAHGADGSAQANSALRELMRATGLRELMRSTLRDTFTHHITAEWICCDPPQKGHKLCKQGHTTLGMVMALLDDRSPILAALDAAVIPAIRAAIADEIERIIGIDPPIDDQDQDIRNVVRHLRGLCTICGEAPDADPCGHAHAINLRSDQ